MLAGRMYFIDSLRSRFCTPNWGGSHATVEEGTFGPTMF